MSKIWDGLLTAERLLITLGLSVVTVLVCVGVVTRYVFSFSFPWLEDLAQYVMLWAAFIGAATCVRRGEHVGIDVIFRVLSKDAARRLLCFLSLVSGSFLTYFACVAASFTWRIGISGQVSASMTFLPMYLVYLSAPVGCALMALEFFRIGWATIRGQYVETRGSA